MSPTALPARDVTADRRRGRLRTARVPALVAACSLFLLLAACGGGGSEAGSDADPSAARDRARAIAREVEAWGDAGTLAEARAHAEAAANLTVGPGGPGYGDRDGDGTVAGEVDEGLLPARSGDAAGIVLATVGDVACVGRDVLGGNWDDPSDRWAELAIAIREWAPTNNTFPDLASHPMRVVGWATLTQDGSFDDAIEYAGHAAIHSDVTLDALADC